MKTLPWLLAPALAVLAVPSTAAPSIEAIYVQGRILDGAPSIPGYIAPEPPPLPFLDGVDGDVVRRLGQRLVTALPNGDFVGAVRTNPQTFGFGNFPSANSTGSGADYLFGSTNRGRTPRALLREATINNASTGNVDQVQRDIAFTAATAGIDYNGNLSYAAGVPDPRPGRSQFQIDSLWENDTLVYLEGDAVSAGPLAGLFLESASQVYRSPSGETRWLASVGTASLPLPGDPDSTVATALLRGTSTFDVILRSGDVIPSLGEVQIGGITNTKWSIGGGHYIAKVDVEPMFTSTDEALTVSGAAVLTNSGGVVREGQLIPTQDGGLPGETWTGFQRLDVNEAGSAIFGGFTSGPTGFNDVVMVDGLVRYREGDTVDGVQLSGSPQAVGINDLGDIAIIWGNHVFINDTLIAAPGTSVDSDRDGVNDATIANAFFKGGEFEITNLPAAGGDGLPIIYFEADVDGEGDAFFRLAAPAPLDGDYNGDGVVDAADYTVWRDTDGSAVLLAADGDEDNAVDAGDYAVWSGNFGASAPATAVPEGSPGFLAALAPVAWRRR